MMEAPNEKTKSLKYLSENITREKIIAIDQHEFQQDLKPPPWLCNMESPFKWARVLKRLLTYYLMYKKLHDYKNQGAFYGFEKFAILLVIILYRTLNLLQSEYDSDEDSERAQNDEKKEESSVDKKENEEAKPDDCKVCIEESLGSEKEDDEDEDEYLYELEEALVKCEETIEEMDANEGDIMYSRIGPVFHHVLQTTKAHVLFLQKREEESKQLAQSIQNIEEMPLECKAGLEGLKVKFIMSMYEDYRVLVPILSNAIQLDPNFGYWHYLTGKVIRRLRRDYNEKMVIEELRYFEKAVELERNPKFLVFLAQAYQEWAALTPGAYGDMLQKAADLYRECWRLKSDSASISKRVGNGMMKMRREYFDKVLAKEALLKSIELSPSQPKLPLGKFYYYHEKDDEKALECFESDAPSHFASPEIIRVNLIKDPNYDPRDVLLAWLNHDQGTLKQQSAHCDSGWYLLMYKNDLERSVIHFWQVLKQDCNSFKVVQFKSYGFLVDGPINMVRVLVNEILLFKKKNESLPPEERKDSKFLNDFLEKVLEKHPDLQNMTPNPNLLVELRAKVEKNIVSKRRQRYEKGFKRVEPSYKTERPGRRNYRTGQENMGEPSRPQEYTNWRRQMRNTADSDSRSNDQYVVDDRRRNSESQSSMNHGRTSNHQEPRNPGYNNTGRVARQYSNNNSSRYDVTITNWRSENRKQ